MTNPKTEVILKKGEKLTCSAPTGDITVTAPPGHVLLESGCYNRLIADNERLKNPTEAMCDGARKFMLGMELGIYNFEAMIEHFRACGEKIPEWMKDRTGHITKWDQAECVWKLMADTIKETPDEKTQ